MSENHRALLGSSDPPLSPEGRQQAEALAETLAEAGIEAIISSRLRRASETARILGRRLGLPPESDPRLNEISYGDWDGLTWAEIERLDPASARAKLDDWRRVTPAGGEPFEKFRARVAAAVRDLLGSADCPTTHAREREPLDSPRGRTVGPVSRPAHSSARRVPPDRSGTVAVVAHVGVNALVEEALRRNSQSGSESHFDWNFVSAFHQDFATYRRIESPET